MENPVYETAQIRQVEQAVFTGGMASDALMDRAGTEAFTVLREHYPQARSLAVLCGSGNNGGDGYVMARLAREAGLEVQVLRASPPKTVDARLMADRAEATGVPLRDWRGDLPQADVYVDALLGIGLTSEVGGVMADMIRALNRVSSVVAVDVPSGVDADTGAIRGVAVMAALTVTFIGHKFGLLTGDGASCAGRVELRGLDLDPALYPSPPLASLLTPADLAFPPRLRNSHKGNFGHVLVIGGDEGYGGAVIMAAEAALRVGAGRVTVLTHPAHVAPLLARCPEIMVRGVDIKAPVDDLLVGAGLVIIGPGLGRRAWGGYWWEKARELTVPTVVDADGLYWMKRSGDRAEGRILTPHPGEAAALLGMTVPEVQNDRRRAAGLLLDRFGGVSVLKGAGSLVVSREGLSLCAAGNPGMATAGMGDVLAGVIGGLAAQFGAGHDTVARAVLVHAMAGDAVARTGQRGLLATDLFQSLRELVNR